MIGEILGNLRNGDTVRGSLSALRQEIKDAAGKETLLSLLENEQELYGYLASEDGKTRKNAALLIGDLGLVQAEDALVQAYKEETQMFVKAAYLKALAKIGVSSHLGELAQRYEELENYEAKPEEKKHIQEELKALEEILRKEGKDKPHTFTGYDREQNIILTTNPKYREITAEQIRKPAQIVLHPLGVRVVTEHLRDILKIRTFRELLFPVSVNKDLTIAEKPHKIGEIIARTKILELIEANHKEEGPFYFRLDVRCRMNLEERSHFAKKVAVSIEEHSGRKLLNSTGDYEFVIRILADKTGKVYVFLKMNTIPMDRFSYRKNAIAASIHPSTAALLMELAKPYMKEKAQILDPCCGVGTMLIERNRTVAAREIYGIDIYGEGIAFAKENTQLAGTRIHYIHRDYLDFKHDYLFDEIISNLPVKGRKTKEEMDEFYGTFFRKCKELMEEDGTMILYSNEAGFIKKQLRLNLEYKLVKEFCIREKDGFYLFIIKIR